MLAGCFPILIQCTKFMQIGNHIPDLHNLYEF